MCSYDLDWLCSVQGDFRADWNSAGFNPLDTGVYRPGVTFMEVPSLPKGEFKISAKFVTGKTVPSKPVPFIVTVQSSQVFNFEHY